MAVADDAWASLLPDVPLDIFRRLETTAVIRCAGACKPWLPAFSLAGRGAGCGRPWLPAGLCCMVLLLCSVNSVPSSAASLSWWPVAGSQQLFVYWTTCLLHGTVLLFACMLLCSADGHCMVLNCYWPAACLQEAEHVYQAYRNFRFRVAGISHRLGFGRS
jgi:hypothetical protein